MGTRQETDNREAKAWYIKYPLDAYALGPYRYDRPKTAAEISELAFGQFGEYPSEIWPEGATKEVDEYEYTVHDEDSEDDDV